MRLRVLNVLEMKSIWSRLSSVLWFLARISFGFKPENIDENIVINDFEKFENLCIFFNIVPNGWVQDPDRCPSKWTSKVYFVYYGFLLINLLRLSALCLFRLPDNILIILGDFFRQNENGQKFWAFWLIILTVIEILKNRWLYKYSRGDFISFRLNYYLCRYGWKSKVLKMDKPYCLKHRFIAHNLVIFWRKSVYIWLISSVIILLLILFSQSNESKSNLETVCTYFWLMSFSIVLMFNGANALGTGGVVMTHLAYFYFRALAVSNKCQELVSKKNQKKAYDKYVAVLSYAIKSANEIEKHNLQMSQFLVVLYIGISFASDFGLYTSLIIHIDRGYADSLITLISFYGLGGIGSCSFINGKILNIVSGMISSMHNIHSIDDKIILLTHFLTQQMTSSCKRLRSATDSLKLTIQSNIKVIIIIPVE